MNNPSNSFVTLSSLIGNTLLPVSQASSTPQFVRVFGTLIVDTDYTFFAGEIIMESQYSRMLITTDNVLNINGVQVHGCEEVWDKIQVSRGELHVINSAISDATTAIFCEKSSF